MCVCNSNNNNSKVFWMQVTAIDRLATCVFIMPVWPRPRVLERVRLLLRLRTGLCLKMLPAMTWWLADHDELLSLYQQNDLDLRFILQPFKLKHKGKDQLDSTFREWVTFSDIHIISKLCPGMMAWCIHSLKGTLYPTIKKYISSSYLPLIHLHCF